MPLPTRGLRVARFRGLYPSDFHYQKLDLSKSRVYHACTPHMVCSCVVQFLVVRTVG
jgi:hypothetical protein